MRYVLVILILLPLFSWGQGNLVPNGGFEELVNCPEMAGQWWNTSDWTNASGGGSPDYFNVCNLPLVFPPDTIYWPHLGIPSNAFGYQDAYSGVAYMGIYCFSALQPDKGEYIQVQLTDSIFPSVRYLVSFYVSLADNGRYSINPIGAYFSKEPIVQQNEVDRIDVLPQVVNTIDNPLTDKDEWVLITDTFNSRYGGERYLTIGNFNTSATSDTIYYFSGDTSGVYAYYYIDDVSVIALDSIPNGVGEVEPLAFKVWPNPAQHHITITAPSALTAASVSIYNISGQRLVSGAYTPQIDISNLPNGVYFIELRNQTSIARQRFVKM
jgi:OOP family OmpA-OmpF porin